MRLLRAAAALALVSPSLLAGCEAPDEPLGSAGRLVERVPLPNWATPEERVIQEQAGPPHVARSTTPPSAGYRVPAEYEPTQAVLMTYTDYPSMLRSIAQAVAGADAEVWMVGGPSSLSGVPAAQYQALDVGFDSVWVRDYGPFGIFEANGALGIIDPTYRHYASRPNDDDVPCALASELGASCHTTSLILDGGNYMTDGEGDVFVTERIYDWNSSLSHAQVDQLLLSYLGATTLHVLAYAKDSWGDPADGTGHIDMYAKIVAPCKVVVAQTTDAPFAAVADAGAAYFAGLACPGGGTYTVYRVPAYESGGTWYTYTNSLIVNQTVILPGYAGGDDAAARAVYQTALPGATVVNVSSDDSIVMGGSIHCVTREIPAVAAGCGSPADCDLPNVATHGCVSGVCGVTTCDAGWADCNGGAADGCERQLGTITDCRGCGDACVFDHAGASCVSGACELGLCADLWGDCNGVPGDGCETSLVSDATCGSCDVTCTGDAHCSAAGSCGGSRPCADADGDGYADSACGGTDCHDGDAAVHPGATETCDRIDEDCDGQIDDDGACGTAGADAGPGADDGSDAGCGCRIPPRRGAPPGGPSLLAALSLAAALLLRRRR